MSETKFTPGPWKVWLDDSGGQFTGWPAVRAPEEIDTSIVHRAGFHQEYWGDLSQRECVANAHLIAAAPDLYAALEELVEYVGDIDWDQPFRDVMTQAKAALAKANGDSPC